MSVYGQHGVLVRVIYLLIAMGWWCGAVIVRALRGGCRGTVVLCYHGVSHRQRRWFSWQMQQLADRAIGADGLDGSLPRVDVQPAVCVTFDDAFANLLANALPVMQQLEVPALVFAVPGNLASTPRWPMPPDHPEAGEPTMSAEQIVRSQSLLCRFGSHTLTHPNLTQLADRSLREQLAWSRGALQELLGSEVEDLALPFGAYDARVIAAARAAGYKRIFTLEPSLRPVGRGVVGRFSMTPDAWRLEFLLTCAGAYAWLQPWRRLLRRLRRGRLAVRKKEPALA